MPQCSAFTLRGQQCARQAANGQTCCAQHAGLTPAELELRRQIVQQRQEEEENRRAAVEQMRAFHNRRVLPLAALLARADEAHAIAQQRIAEARGQLNALPPIHADGQNVHRREVNEAQKPLLTALVKGWFNPDRTLDDAMLLYKKTFTPATKGGIQRLFAVLCRSTEHVYTTPAEFREFLEFGQTNARQVTYELKVVNTDGRAIHVNLQVLLTLAIDAICSAPAEHREPLRARLLQEIGEGRGTCSAGRFARILNAFTGFEESVLRIPPVDPRSLNERLGDLFAALSRQEMDSASRVKAGLRILNENGVTDLRSTAAWLDAL